MAWLLFNRLRRKKAGGEYAAELLKICTPPQQFSPQSLGIIFDSYTTSTTKQLTQRRRGNPDRRVYITSAKQCMPKSSDWDSFLRNGENKSELIQFLVRYYKTDEARGNLRLPMIVTEEEKTWLITRTSIQELESCNHYEADTRLVLHASQSAVPVIVRATDTDVLILLSYAYVICKPAHEWLSKINNRYVSIEKLANTFGEEVCRVLPGYHTLTGCDTTSYPFGIGKMRPFKKMIKSNKIHLLSNLGRSTESSNDISGAKRFLQTCMYTGTEGEEFVQTRIKSFNKQKIKSSLTIFQMRTVPKSM